MVTQICRPVLSAPRTTSLQVLLAVCCDSLCLQISSQLSQLQGSEKYLLRSQVAGESKELAFRQMQGLLKGLSFGQRQGRGVALGSGPQSPPDVMLSGGRNRSVRTAAADAEAPVPLIERYLSERIASPTTVAAIAAGAAAQLFRGPPDNQRQVAEEDAEQLAAAAETHGIPNRCDLPRRHSMGGPLPTPRAGAQAGIRTVRLSSPSRPVPTRRGSDRFRVYIEIDEEAGGGSEVENASPRVVVPPIASDGSAGLDDPDVKSQLTRSKQPVITLIARSDSAGSCFLGLSNVIASPPLQAVV